jgi:hypothetical protein
MSGSTQAVASDRAALTLSPADAIYTIRVSADGVLMGEEAARLSEVFKSTHWVLHPGLEGPGRVATHALDLIAQYGLTRVLAACAAVIPPELRATTFALATDLALSDGRLGSRENMLLDELQRALGITDDLARKIIEVLLIKNRASGRPDF